jgi:DNA-3-methyladenine glycosylase II
VSKSNKIIEYFANQDPILFSFIEKVGFPTIQKSSDHFVFLCESIISQQLSIKAADTIFDRFKKLFPRQITPKVLLKLSEEELRTVGISYSKISYLKNLASAVVSKNLDLPSFETKSDEEVIFELTKIKGIGKWTAEMFLMSSLGRENVFSYGDLGLKKALQNIYMITSSSTIQEIELIITKWSPYKTYAAKILWKSLSIK